MERILSYKKFYDALNENDLSSGVYSIEDITNLESWKRLSSIGAKNSTTPLIWKNQNFKITHPRFFRNDSITIYSNGPIRKTSSGRPHILSHRDPINSIEDWNERFGYVEKYILKSIAKNDFGITSTIALDQLTESPSYFFNSLWERDPSTFQKWFNELQSDFAEKIISHLNIEKIFNDDMGKATFLFKKYLNNPSIKEVTNLLDPSISKKIKIVGGMGELGF